MRRVILSTICAIPIALVCGLLFNLGILKGTVGIIISVAAVLLVPIMLYGIPGAKPAAGSAKISEDGDIPAEIIAAIGIAIAKYEKDDIEKEPMMLTIKRISHTYSPWNSKIYGVFNQLNRK
jgi:hypothetical protein